MLISVFFATLLWLPFLHFRKAERTLNQIRFNSADLTEDQRHISIVVRAIILVRLGLINDLPTKRYIESAWEKVCYDPDTLARSEKYVASIKIASALPATFTAIALLTKIYLGF